MVKVTTTRIAAGAYKTTNTVPVAHIERCYDGDGWTVSYDGDSSRWASKKECMSLIESISSMIADGEEITAPICIV